MRFAIALVVDPDLLVLDEPTVAMDVEARRTPSGTTMRGVAARGKTVVFATHYLEEADAYADRIVLMATGRIVADGPDDRDQGEGRRAARSGRRCPASAAPSCAAAARRRDGRAPRRGRRAHLHRLRRGAPRAARRATRRRATSRSRGAGLEEAFLELTTRRRRTTPEDWRTRGMSTAATYTRYELLRTFRNRRFFIFSLVFPLILYFLIAGPNRDQDDCRQRHLGAALLHGRPGRLGAR